MCQAPVGKVIKVGKGTVTVSYKKGTKELDSKLVELKKGDYVMFSLDIAIEKIDEEEAKMMLGCV